MRVLVQERHKLGKTLPAELALIVGQSQHRPQGGPKLRDAVEELLHQHLHMPTRQLQGMAPKNAGQVQLKLCNVPVVVVNLFGLSLLEHGIDLPI